MFFEDIYFQKSLTAKEKGVKHLRKKNVLSKEEYVEAKGILL